MRRGKYSTDIAEAVCCVHLNGAATLYQVVEGFPRWVLALVASLG